MILLVAALLTFCVHRFDPLRTPHFNWIYVNLESIAPSYSYGSVEPLRNHQPHGNRSASLVYFVKFQNLPRIYISHFFHLDLDNVVGPTNKHPCLTIGNLPHSFSVFFVEFRTITPLVTCIRDLEVPFDTTFTSSVHCRETANTTRRLL